MGRPQWKPTEQTLEDVRKLAAQGMTEAQISDCLGISQETLIQKKKQYSEFSEALKRGKAEGLKMVTDELLKQIKLGNPASTMFYLKCRGGWKETSVLELPDRKQIADMTDEELDAIIAGRKI